MRRKLFLLAVAAAALASCSSDETLSVNQGLEDANTISFRPAIQGMTRAANGAGLKSAFETGDILYVTAIRTGATPSPFYFKDRFVKDGTGFNSSAKHFWPANSDLTSYPMYFTAFWGAEYYNWAAANDEYKLGAGYTVPADATAQKDLLFAKSVSMSSRPANGMVTLNFRHMLSQIVVKVANDQENLNITITGVRVGFLNKAGTFNALGVVDTDTKTGDASNSGGATLLDKDYWTKTDNTLKNASYLFAQDFTSTPTVLTGEQNATVLSGFSSWILMPQALSVATAYTSARTSAGPVDDSAKDLNGAYLALEMEIKDKTTGATIVGKQWCYWPIGTIWNPGYRYTYTINAGSGGYQPTDQDNNVDLDPVLDNLVIWFAPACTIDTWVDENYGISAPIARTASYAFADGGAQTISLEAGANGTYDITITGLTAGHTVTASATNNFAATPTVSNGGIVPANGTLTITGTLTANTTAAVSSVIRITDSSASQSMTITINQAAPAN